MTEILVSPQKALHIFGHSSFPKSAALPPFARSEANGRELKSWSLQQLSFVGEAIGFLSKPRVPCTAALFVTKGGVLKTSLTVNLARMAALHNIRTCVIGLDLQGDISTALGADVDPEESWTDALQRLDKMRGLADVYSGAATLEEVICATDLPKLCYIPETPELVSLEQALANKNRREYWLTEKIVTPLKQQFDLILFDCPPNWNRLIINALVACDLLLSPLECKINNFRNLKAFQALLNEFKNEMSLNFDHLYIPTRLNQQRRLSQEIYAWYQEHLPNCAKQAVRDSVQGEEASALKKSVVEYAPKSSAAEEMRVLSLEIWKLIESSNLQQQTLMQRA